MSELVANCPRCKAKKITFDLYFGLPTHIDYGWRRWYEACCVCRECSKSTIFVLSQKEIKFKELLKEKNLAQLDCAINDIMNNEGYISLKDEIAVNPPEHMPPDIEAAYREGAKCLAIGCYNAAGTMFRLSIDLSTRAMLPADDVTGLNSQVRRNLGLRLPWLFDNGKLPESLKELSTCIKDDGNDAAHEGTLSKEDAADILDFTFELLERIYTEPMRLELAKERRLARRANTDD